MSHSAGKLLSVKKLFQSLERPFLVLTKAGAAVEVDGKIRGLSPFPGAWFEFDGQRIKLLASRLAEGAGAPGEVLDDALTVACGEGAVQVLRLQRAGRGPQDAAEFLRGTKLPRGTRL